MELFMLIGNFPFYTQNNIDAIVKRYCRKDTMINFCYLQLLIGSLIF